MDFIKALYHFFDLEDEKEFAYNSYSFVLDPDAELNDFNIKVSIIQNRIDKIKNSYQISDNEIKHLIFESIPKDLYDIYKFSLNNFKIDELIYLLDVLSNKLDEIESKLNDLLDKELNEFKSALEEKYKID